MIFTQEIIDKILSNNLEIDYIDITLVQRKENNPYKYKGNGTIYQDENGKLKLKMYTKYDDIKNEFSNFNKRVKPGKILPEEKYYDLIAVEMQGREWKSENIYINREVYTQTTGIIIKADLNEIENEEQRNGSEKTNLFILIPEELDIPLNKFEEISKYEKKLNTCEFNVNGVGIIIKKYDKYTTINIKSNEIEIDDILYTKLIEALEIITGKIIKPKAIKLSKKEKEIYWIKSVDERIHNKKLPEPFKHNIPYVITEFSNFIGKYVSQKKNKDNRLFGFWYKINRAWQIEIENTALTLVVGIEGLAKSYFKEMGLPDDEIVNQAKRALLKIKKLKIGGRIKDRIKSSINNLLNNPSPKSILYKLREDNIINNKMVKNWESLRNQAVHAGKQDWGNGEFQKYLDKIYSCITLFNILIFKIIEYDGKYVDYSEEDWPEKECRYLGINDEK